MIQPHSIAPAEHQNAFHPCGHVMENLNAQMEVMKDKIFVVSLVKPVCFDAK